MQSTLDQLDYIQKTLHHLDRQIDHIRHTITHPNTTSHSTQTDLPPTPVSPKRKAPSFVRTDSVALHDTQDPLLSPPPPKKTCPNHHDRSPDGTCLVTQDPIVILSDPEDDNRTFCGIRCRQCLKGHYACDLHLPCSGCLRFCNNDKNKAEDLCTGKLQDDNFETIAPKRKKLPHVPHIWKLILTHRFRLMEEEQMLFPNAKARIAKRLQFPESEWSMIRGEYYKFVHPQWGVGVKRHRWIIDHEADEITHYFGNKLSSQNIKDLMDSVTTHDINFEEAHIWI